MSMDVKGILQNQADDLLDIEIDCLEEELSTGGYDPAYRKDCNALIEAIRHARKVGAEPRDGVSADSSGGGVAKGAYADPRSLSPYNDVPIPKRTDSEVVAHDLAAMRRLPDRKTRFKAYLAQSPHIDEGFCDAHFDIFTRDEMSMLLETRSFSEAFLEKYFASLDHDKVARYQKFSEAFFIEHFAELDPKIVLKSGCNDWRKPNSMSSRLNVFLRLKGVRL